MGDTIVISSQSTEPKGAPGFSFPRLIQPILDRHCIACHNRESVASGESTISLEGKGELDTRSLKSWSDAYRTLASPEFATWISPQSAPTMQPRYAAGAAKSELIDLLADSHQGVELSRAELELIACWIDLGVPFAGDYTEGMREEDIPVYERYLAKRQREADEVAKRIEALLETR